jgi:hypothetical protein
MQAVVGSPEYSLVINREMREDGCGDDLLVARPDIGRRAGRTA